MSENINKRGKMGQGDKISASAIYTMPYQLLMHWEYLKFKESLKGLPVSYRQCLSLIDISIIQP